MKREMVIGLLTGILVVMGSGIASAGWDHDPGIQNREMRQERRINHGIESGRLTPWEVRRLDRQQARIERMEAWMRSDGCLTPRERWRLRQAQSMASRDIWRYKHNGYWR